MRLADLELAQAVANERDETQALIDAVEKGLIAVTIGKIVQPEMAEVVKTPVLAALRLRREFTERKLQELGVDI